MARKFYQQHNKSMRPRGSDQVWVAVANNQVVGAVRQRYIGPHALLTGLFVAPTWRGKGIGGMLCQALSAQQTGPLFLFCQPSLIPYYQPLGFDIEPTPPAEVADKLQRLNKGLQCMRKPLKARQ
ncbi:GNAT family N-acetyltransferase [Salinibius halmophilus]|uniref:GNAT family N-acetyltransferase n=1 Tax=Salinibius halmophilus TaxID=1853216 RepID=UPI000E6656E5|nr:GNAT family N-acetyltransferase [Salinibius halmophilus]